MLSGREIRFIVVNDGSKRGFTEEAVRNLTTVLPDTIVVDNKINQGKGAAVRDGIARSDSKLLFIPITTFRIRLILFAR